MRIFFSFIMLLFCCSFAAADPYDGVIVDFQKIKINEEAQEGAFWNYDKSYLTIQYPQYGQTYYTYEMLGNAAAIEMDVGDEVIVYKPHLSSPFEQPVFTVQLVDQETVFQVKRAQQTIYLPAP